MILVLAPLAVVASTAHPVSMEHFFVYLGQTVCFTALRTRLVSCACRKICHRSYV
jgi:hypothetical protein